MTLVVELWKGQVIVVLERVELLIGQCWGELAVLVEWAAV